MARTDSGPIDQAPQPDPEQMATDTLMMSVFTGASFVVATVVLAALGGVGARLGFGLLDSATGTRIGMAVGLALGTGMIYLGVRRYETPIRARSVSLYRGIWLGTLLSLTVIVLMYYFPQVVIPGYCQAGGNC